MSDQKIRVGVIGFGASAKTFHIPLITTTPSMVLYSILQRNPTATNSAPSSHPSVKHFTTTADFLADPGLDLVVITTTPDSHFSLCTLALNARKHVLLEKPAVPTASEATALSQLGKQVGRFICVYQNRRWDTDFLTFQQLRADGVLGRIVEFETHFDRYKAERYRNWKGALTMDQAGGVIYDLGTHLLDQAVVAFGMPKSVTGFFAVQRDDPQEGEEPDSFTAILRYADGLLVTAKAGVMCVESTQLRYWVRGTKGSWHKCHLDVQEDQLKTGLKPGDDEFGKESDDRAGQLTVLENGNMVTRSYRNVEPQTYSTLYAGFAKAILEDNPALIPVKIEEARDVLLVIEAIRASAQMGQTVDL